jgi:hypothetical protein
MNGFVELELLMFKLHVFDAMMCKVLLSAAVVWSCVR